MTVTYIKVQVTQGPTFANVKNMKKKYKMFIWIDINYPLDKTLAKKHACY